MRIKPWIRDNGTEFYELIDVSGFAVGHVFNKEAAELFAAAPELLASLKHLLEIYNAVNSIAVWRLIGQIEDDSY